MITIDTDAFFVDMVRNQTKTTTTELFEPVETVTVPAVKEFVAKEYFQAGKNVLGVRISFGSGFERRFLGKIERDIPGCDIRIHRLPQAASQDPAIPTETSKEQQTYLAHLWHFLKSRGDSGGCFVFCIPDFEGTLSEVIAYCTGDSSWDLGACPVNTR